VADFDLPDLTAKVRLDLTELEGAVSKASAIGGAVGGAIGGIAAGGIDSAVGAVKDFALGSVDAFAQLEDATAAGSVLFGSSMDKVASAAEGAAGRVGISQQAYIDAAGVFGTLGKSAGLTGDPLAKFGTGMADLAGDLASFKGTSPEEAIDAVGAALRGESEPIRKYGVLLDDATLRAEAMKMGLIKSTKEGLTPQQKVLAAQSAILKQTGDAQGDFARTADSTANTQKRLAAESANAQAQLGAKLAPAVTAVRLVMLDLITALTGGFTWLEKNKDILIPLAAGLAIATLALTAQATATAVVSGVTKAWAAVQAAMNAVLSANPIGIVIAVIALLVAGIIIAYKRSDTFRAIVQAAFRGIQVAISTSMNVARSVIAAVMGFIHGTVSGRMAAVRAVVVAVFNAIRTVISVQINLARTIIGGVLSIITGLFTGNFGKAKDGAVRVMRALITYLGGLGKAIKGALSGMGTLLLGIGGDIIGGLRNGIKNGTEHVLQAVRDLVSKIPGPIKKLLGIASPSKVTRALGAEVGAGLELGIRDGISGVADAASAAASAAVPPTISTPAVGPAAAAGGPLLTELGPASLQALLGALSVNLQVLLDSEPIAARVNERLGATASFYDRTG
jgi:hypothetical protein